jgi:hypothetical protein
MGLFLVSTTGRGVDYDLGVRQLTPNNGTQKMTSQQAFELAMAICQNEKKDMSEIDDSQIGYYLADRDIEETAENIAMIRNA